MINIFNSLPDIRSQKYFPRLLLWKLRSYLCSMKDWTLQPHFSSTFGTTLCASQTISTRSLTIWWPLSDYCLKIFARSLTLQLLRVIYHLEQSCKPHLTQQGQQTVLSLPPCFLDNFLGSCVSRKNKAIMKKEIPEPSFQRAITKEDELEHHTRSKQKG